MYEHENQSSSVRFLFKLIWPYAFYHYFLFFQVETADHMHLNTTFRKWHSMIKGLQQKQTEKLINPCGCLLTVSMVIIQYDNFYKCKEWTIMFLIAGVQPKTKTLSDTPRLCSVCGLARAYEKRVDHYFSFFFIPIIRVKKGESFFMCDRCQATVSPMGRPGNRYDGKGPPRCRACGKKIEPDHQFCPWCGQPNP